MRMLYFLQSIWKLKRASLQGVAYRDIFQAGKSVAGIHAAQSAGDIVREYAAALQEEKSWSEE